MEKLATMKMSLTELCRMNPDSPAKCREVTVKKKRVEIYGMILLGRAPPLMMLTALASVPSSYVSQTAHA